MVALPLSCINEKTIYNHPWPPFLFLLIHKIFLTFHSHIWLHHMLVQAHRIEEWCWFLWGRVLVMRVYLYWPNLISLNGGRQDEIRLDRTHHQKKKQCEHIVDPSPRDQAKLLWLHSHPLRQTLSDIASTAQQQDSSSLEQCLLGMVMLVCSKSPSLSTPLATH